MSMLEVIRVNSSSTTKKKNLFLPGWPSSGLESSEYQLRKSAKGFQVNLTLQINQVAIRTL